MKYSASIAYLYYKYFFNLIYICILYQLKDLISVSLYLCTKLFLWENLVIRGNFLISMLLCIFPSTPRSTFENMREYFLRSLAPARSLPCALKSVDEDVNKYVIVDFDLIMTTVMRKTDVHGRVDMLRPGRTQYQLCWENTMPSLIYCPST